MFRDEYSLSEDGKTLTIVRKIVRRGPTSIRTTDLSKVSENSFAGSTPTITRTIPTETRLFPGRKSSAMKPFWFR